MEKILIPTPSELMLTLKADMVEDIKQAAGVREEVWTNFFLPTLKTFAEHVQRLPLARQYFVLEYGAFEFGLLCARLAVQVAPTQMFFPAALSEERRVLEPQCQFAAFVAALATGVTMAAQNTQVKDADDDAEYHVLVSPISLLEWLKKHPDATLQWRDSAGPLAPPHCAAIGARFVPAGLLNDFDLRVALMIFESIAPQPPANGVESTLSRVVRQSAGKVIEHHRNQERKAYAPGSAIHATAPAPLGSLMPTLEAAPQPPQAADGTAGKGESAPPAQPVAVTPEAAMELAQGLLTKSNPALQEWFRAMRTHPNYEKFLSKVELGDKGISVPITMLGEFGVSGQLVRKMMQDGELIVERTPDSRGIILRPELKPFFTNDKT